MSRVQIPPGAHPYYVFICVASVIHTMDTVNVRLPDEQIYVLDKQVSRLHYASRSEFVREAIRRMMEDHMDLSDETVKAIKQARRQKSISHAELKKRLGL
jgi:Arc/MetJ-type ribon-helix-helix transcriptional regulator